MTVSVVITTKNRKDFLYRALNSINNNTKTPKEVIVVNDGGEKITLENTDFKFNLVLINNSDSLGGNKARNQGIKASSGDIIFFLDDDDAYTPNSISERIKLFEDPDVVLAFTGVKFVNSNNLDLILREKKTFSENITYKKLLSQGNLIGSTSCVAVRREAIFSAGLFDENVVALQDYETWLRISKLGKIVHDNHSNLIYTLHVGNNQISSKYERYLNAGEYIFNKYKKDLISYNIYNDFLSQRYLRVAISASSTSESIKYKYALKSLKYKFNLQACALLLPTKILKKFKDFT
ncbi:glycosyltransferase family 2 protein [Photobacterium leiognathi]|uniref:glycosyltransferase family 2 protein n=1 Tax=Photobacterium leiognathi TaxID=553611 RepID=UPI002980D76D|nr:glycosyltransferase family 2 protein [Photobacterium leiognathi]